MRLERDHDAAAGIGGARRGQRRLHLDRMVAVVVDQREAAAVPRRHRDLAVALEPPADAAELGERRDDRLVGRAEFAADGDRGERVAHVVLADQVQLDIERRSSPARSTPKRMRVAFGPDVDRPDRGICRRSRR